jgi:putative oxidoreductase
VGGVAISRVNIFMWCGRVACGSLFLGVGISKIDTTLLFSAAIDAYQILPYVMTTPLALYLPWLEVTVGAALLVRRTALPAVCIGIVLASVFAIATGSALLRGLDIACGCFGPDGGAPLWLTMTIDIVLLAMLILLFFRYRREGAGRSHSS